MVRTPTKSCPNLHRVLTEAPTQLLARFLTSKQFERFAWLEGYRFVPEDPNGRDLAKGMLEEKPKSALGFLEAEATRIVTIAGNRGQFALEGLLREAEDEVIIGSFMAQGDELGRSLWSWLDCTRMFDAAENILHLRMYRRYDKHYQTFAVMPVHGDGTHADTRSLSDFLEEIQKGLNRGAGCNIDRFGIPAEGDEPEAEMYIIRHPNLPTVAREIDEKGEVSRFYFRPPGEAMVVFVPSTGRVHVRADTRAIRHLVWKAFVTKTLSQEISHQPVDFQAYDISRFLNNFELPLPDVQEALIKRANMIRLEASIGDLANRISVTTTLNRGVREVIDGQSGLDRVFANAVAIRFVEIAVKYRREGRKEDQVVAFTISDGNTSSLLSLDDPFEQTLGHRLLKEWGVLVEGRAPAVTDFHILMPAMLALWNEAAERVTGAWLVDRNLNAGSLLDFGFLVPQGWEEEDLVEDGDFGSQEAGVHVEPKRIDLVLVSGQAAPTGNPERYRRYRVRADWVIQYLKTNVVHLFGSKTVEVITPNLLYLGQMKISDISVPIYLARRLHDEKSHAETDTALRSRSEQGIGLVLNAGRQPCFTLAANVRVTFTEYLAASAADASEVASVELNLLQSAFLRHRNLAQGGEVIELQMTGEHAGTLRVPGKGTIDIVGENRLLVISRLVAEHKKSGRPMKTEDMTRDLGGQSLANIFSKEGWDKLKRNFLHSPKKGFWQIAT